MSVDARLMFGRIADKCASDLDQEWIGFYQAGVP